MSELKFKVGDVVKFVNSGYTFDGEEGIIVACGEIYNVRRLKSNDNRGWAVYDSNLEYSKNYIVTHILNDL